MRKVVLNLASTLDGYIEGPNGEIDWLVRDESIDFGDILTEILSDKDVIFYGRVSYEKWGNFRPDQNVNPKLSDAYDLMHKKQKYVFSRSLTGDGSDATFINSNIAKRVSEIKSQPGKNIWLYGGAKIITSFLNLDLIDEYRLAVHPVILGKGKRLFQNIEARHKLTLIDSKAHSSGVTLMNYKKAD